MLMKDDKRRGGMVSIIMKKLKGGDTYDRMREHNEESMERVPMEDGAEQDYSMGHDSAAQEMMRAIDSKDPQMLKRAVMSLFEMMMNEQSNKNKDEY